MQLNRILHNHEDALNDEARHRLENEFNDDFFSNLANYAKAEQIEAYESAALTVALGDDSAETIEILKSTLRNAFTTALEKYVDDNFEETHKDVISEIEDSLVDAMID
jgi:hypothetical protein